MNNFSFSLHNTMHAGIGWSRDHLGELVRSLGWQHVAVFVDRAVADTPYFHEVMKGVDAPASVRTGHLPGTEPTYDLLSDWSDTVRMWPALDGVIGIGGGSTMDMAKALACLRTNWLPAIQYRGFDKLTKPGVPVICIPTTAGSGSEVTPNAVFIDTKEKRKLGINGRYVAAQYAILDAEWMASCPAGPKSSAHMDAIVHACESWMCNQANILTRSIGEEAFIRLTRGFVSQQECLIGAYLAAAALCNSGSGVAGALSYPLGVHFGIPHGIAGGMFIADAVKFNEQRGVDVLACSQQIRDMAWQLNIPQSLTPWFLLRRDLDRIMDLIAPVEPAFAQNPVPFTLADAREIINKHLED